MRHFLKMHYLFDTFQAHVCNVLLFSQEDVCYVMYLLQEDLVLMLIRAVLVLMAIFFQ